MKRYFVISDLHLGMGRQNNGQEWHPLEDFRSDSEAAFEKFLNFMEQENADELIINGDWIDFLQLEPFAYQKNLFAKNGQRLGWTQEQSLQKLESCKAAHAHQGFFTRLSDFLQTGKKVTVIMGNHDPDLFWPEVKAEIYKLLKPPTLQQLEFVQTFVRRGSAHIEHGNQHCSPENKFQNPEKVFHLCDTDNQEHLEMVWGSIFVMEFFNSIEYTHPYADKIKPTLNALWLGIKNGWINSEVVGMFVKFLKGAGIPWNSLAELLSDQERSPMELIQSIKDKRIARQLLEIYARDSKLKSSVDEEIARTTEAEWKSINSLNNDPLVTLDELMPLVDEPSPTLGIFRESTEFRGARNLLQQPGVQHVIFGHTHTEIDGADSNAPVKNYFNTGTWIRRLDLKNKENRELLKNITQDDLKRDELFELRLMTAVIEVADENYTRVSLQQLRM